jgi:hypothetical protein
MPPAKGSAVPDSHHVLRYISRKHVDPDKNEFTGSGFLARLGEGCPSVNWIECFAPPIENQLAGIRAEKRLKYEKRGKLARLNVRGTREYVVAEGATILAFLHDQEDATEKYPEHTSHCVIQGVPELNTPEGELIGDLLLDCVLETYEVVPG